jgi:PleD family two-component response regulator
VQQRRGHDCIDLVLSGFATVLPQTLLAQNFLSKVRHTEYVVEIMPRIDRRNPAHAIAELLQKRIHFRAHSGL